ncbi:MAG TPA: LCP family protein [Nocardioidaceae bacterium]|nr:LCP family protein [Nocardioidaceae bacterium]
MSDQERQPDPLYEWLYTRGKGKAEAESAADGDAEGSQPASSAPTRTDPAPAPPTARSEPSPPDADPASGTAGPRRGLRSMQARLSERRPRSTPPSQPSPPDAEAPPSSPPAPGDEGESAPEPTRALEAPPAEAPAEEHEPAATAGPAEAGTPAAPAGARRAFGGTYPAPPAAAPAEPRSGRSSTSRARPAGGSPPRTSPRWSPPPPTPPGGSPKGPSRRVVRRVITAVLLLLLAWLLFLIAVPVYAWTQVITKVDASPIGARPVDGPGRTYLLVGSDSRAGLTKKQEAQLGTGAAVGQRTDTILLLHVPSHGGPKVLLSIPRDSYVAIAHHGHNKINAAYAFGGAPLLVETVERATGIRVDDYVEVGFTGLVDIVNAVGGIRVCPKTSIVDPKAGNLHMRAGCQHINGQKALDYSRSRAFPKGDITREAHQREVIGAIGHQALSWSTLLPWKYWKVNMSGARAVRVGNNVSPISFGRFVWALTHTGKGTKRCVVPYSSLGTATSAGSAVIWNKAKADVLFRQIRTDRTRAINCPVQ